MIRTSLVAGFVALAVWYAFGVIGPYPVFRTAPSVDVARVDQLNAYQDYLTQKTAGTWDAAKAIPPQPASLRFLLFTGINGPNMAISGVIATFGAVVIVYGLSGIARQARVPRWLWAQRRHSANGRADRQEERVNERREREPERAYR